MCRTGLSRVAVEVFRMWQGWHSPLWGRAGAKECLSLLWLPGKVPMNLPGRGGPQAHACVLARGTEGTL